MRSFCPCVQVECKATATEEAAAAPCSEVFGEDVQYLPLEAFWYFFCVNLRLCLGKVSQVVNARRHAIGIIVNPKRAFSHTVRISQNPLLGTFLDCRGLGLHL